MAETKKDQPGNNSFDFGREPSPTPDAEKNNRKTRTYQLTVDKIPYIVETSPFSFNGEQRFYVSINGGADHVFTWDSELGRLRAIDDEAGILPEMLEEEISKKLEAEVA